MALPSIPGCRGRVGGLVLDSQSSLNPPNKAVKQTLREPDRAVDATGACEVRTEEDVDSGGDHEPVAVLRRGLAHGREPLRVPVGIAKAAGGVVGVLEVAAGGSRGPQRSHQLGRLHAVAGLGVDRHGHLDAPCDPRGRGEHLVGRRTFAVLIAERGGHAAAGGCDHRRPSRDHGSRRGHVPGIRKQKGSLGRCSDRSRSHRLWSSLPVTADVAFAPPAVMWLARSSDYLVDLSGSRLAGRGRRSR